MIRLDDTERTDAPWTKWRTECDAAQVELNAAFAAHDPSAGEPRPEVSSTIYAKLKEEHYAAKRAPFWGKCAYCEQRIRSSQPGDIEHFRPKARVTDHATNARVQTRDGRGDHPGYYWLGYDWRNLLLACASCNRPHKRSNDARRIGKWDHFPLVDESKRAEAPGQEQSEEPLLINPLVEDPAEHLAVAEDGVVHSIDGSPRGQACIDLLGLNDRDLPDDRRQAYKDAYRMFTFLTLARLERNQTKIAELEEELRDIELGSRPHAISARLAIRDAKARIGG